MPHTWKIAPNLEKCATLGKKCHISKKCGTVGKIKQPWKNAPKIGRNHNAHTAVSAHF